MAISSANSCGTAGGLAVPMPNIAGVKPGRSLCDAETARVVIANLLGWRLTNGLGDPSGQRRHHTAHKDAGGGQRRMADRGSQAPAPALLASDHFKITS